jgi:hypothetical protein
MKMRLEIGMREASMVMVMVMVIQVLFGILAFGHLKLRIANFSTHYIVSYLQNNAEIQKCVDLSCVMC